jgi:nucleotide-binding universal stress UspA family protein
VIQESAQQESSATRETPFKRILVPLDGSRLAERALFFARSLARALGSELILTRAAHVRMPLGGAAAPARTEDCPSSGGSTQTR